MKQNYALLKCDDFGISPGVNKALMDIIDRRSYVNAGIMANMDFAKQAVDYAKTNHEAKIWLHFNLTLGKPLGKDVARITAADGSFIGFNSFFKYYFSGRIKLADIINEYHAQVRYLLDHNISIIGVDSHHHVHFLPGIFREIADSLDYYGIKHIRASKSGFKELGQTSLRSIIKTAGLNYFIRANKVCQKSLVDCIVQAGEGFDLDCFESFLKQLSCGGFKNCEVIFHPGYPGDEYLNKIDSLTDQRKNDLDILLSDSFFDLLKKYDFLFDCP
jgi:predicted glycoside hydrolase/deacetylase ChbG (UPF0249 family)